jgi:MoaA/NifB/PqqE/SkfB family radical SAM enzyme
MVNLNVNNFAAWRKRPRQSFEVIRFDSNHDCNIHCAYCVIPRSDALIDLGEFRAFLAENVEAVNVFQFGCQMEPTLDKRLIAFMRAVGESAAKPLQTFRLQTNGILLHRHDPDEMRAAGLSLLTVSMDAADPELVKQLRGGTSSRKVYRNVETFHRRRPEVAIVFVAVVTRLNIDAIDDLVAAGIDIGVSRFNLRQVIYPRDSALADHDLMKTLVVSVAEFLEMAERVSSKYANVAKFHIQSAPQLNELSLRTREESAPI